MHRIKQTDVSYYIIDNDNRIVANFPFRDNKQQALKDTKDWINFLETLKC